jgi:CBS domain containing-hemolysin-like protein
VAAADPTGWPLGVVDADSAAAVPAEGRDRTAIASVTVAQPAAWVVALPTDAALTDLIRVMSERELSLAVVVDEATRDIRGLASAERINAVVGAELSRRGRR